MTFFSTCLFYLISVTFFYVFQYGRTLLQECVTLSDVDMVQSLIEYGEADVNAQNDVRKNLIFLI